MFSAIPQARSRPHLPCKFHRAFQIKLQEKMRGQNYCLLASPVTSRRWGLRLYNAYSCEGKGAARSVRSFVALLQASLLKTSPVSRLKTIRKDECFRQSWGPEALKKVDSIRQAK